MCVDISGLLEVFLSSDIIVVGREERWLLVLRREAGALAFDQVTDEAVVAAVPLQCSPAGTVKELWLRCLLQVEKAVTGLVEGLGRSGSSIARSTGMGMPQDSANMMYLLTVPLYKSSCRPIDRFDSPSRWRRNACLILFISLHLPAMACSIYG